MKIIHGAVTVEETTAAVSIPEGKTNMINVDYVGKKIIGQRTTVIVFFVEFLPTLSEIALGIKERIQPT